MKLNQFSRLIAISTVATAGACLSISSQAQAVVLNFDGLTDNTRVQDFYNGTGGVANNFGASFTASGNNNGATARTEGGSGPNFTNEPSPSNVMFIVGANVPNFLNIANGFTDFSFSYGSRANRPSTINIFSGINGTGSLLGTLQLGSTTSNNSVIDDFDLASISFGGTAKSVQFLVANSAQIAFDNISFTPFTNSASVPEPFTIIGTIIGGTAAVRMRKKLKSNKA
jgi:hypothetical protein